ncbi:manganese efflux pump [Pseudoxanthomonas sp. SGD-10]|nr:manganese efflux pump [Pseudoxanthomonas sp. SGD-10]
MRPLSILMIGLAMSTDAFAAAVGKGAAMQRPGIGLALRTGLLFGVIEGITPVIGWLLGIAAARYITAWDHWIAFALLVLLGLHMIWHGIHPDDDEDGESPARRHGFWNMALLALGTSIDAMAVGVSLAFLDAPIAVVALVIGLCTMVMVTIGILLGRVFGALVGRRAELAGGIVMIVIGAAILHEHLGGAA